MEPFTTLKAVAAPLDIANVDTDRIIPARFLRQPRSAGYHNWLFHDLREQGGFVLDHPEFKTAKILVAAENFGCGSSREHAPWALYDYGFRAVISTEIADIFTSNALKNGLLPIVVSQDVWDDLASQPDQPVTIDLEARQIRRGNAQPVPFEVESFARQCLLNGVDTLGWLQSNLPEIEAFERSRETV